MKPLETLERDHRFPTLTRVTPCICGDIVDGSSLIGTSPGIFVDKTGIFKLASSFAHLNQVFFVHKPSQSKSTALLQLKVKNWALWNLKLWHEEVSSFNMSVVLQKCILPTAILGGHFFSFTSLTAVVGWILLPVVPVFSNCYVQYELASAPSVPSCLHTACSTAFCLPCFFLPNKDRLWSWFDLHRPWYPFLC